MRLVLYILFLIIANSIYSQKTTVLSDVEYQKLHDKARLLVSSNIDSSFLYASKIEKSNNYLHQSFAIGLKSYLYQLRDNDSVKSKQFYERALNLLNKVPFGKERIKMNSYLLNFGGLAEWKRGNFSKALGYYFEGKKLSNKIGDLKQVIKFNNNISTINSEVGNYGLAIRAAKESDLFTDKIEYLYTEEQFNISKSNININLGNFYKKQFSESRGDKFLLDSAGYYYKKAILFSKDILNNKIVAEMNLGNVYLLQQDYNNAKKIHHKISRYLSKKEGFIKEYSLTNRNLGELYYVLNEYDKALIYFQKVDSIYKNKKNINIVDFLNSKYYQAKIWATKGEYQKALSNSEKYLENFEKHQVKLNEETIGVNYALSADDLKKEMIKMEAKYKNRNLLIKLFYGFIIILFILLIFGLIKKHKDKKKIDRKLNELIVQYKKDIENRDFLDEPKPDLSSIEIEFKREIPILSIDEEKENEIVEKLKKLEEKLVFLSSDFTQQMVAKKIKTNTTYLSYVVNKRFGKSFSEYSNELKLNYVISEMISNPTYRKYSTQAIAESVGFKNAVSFTKSFSKRTGVTPVQFVKKIENSR